MIIPAGPRSTESEITQALLAYLTTCAYGEANFKNIFFNLPKYIRLTPQDWEVSRERPAEKKWNTIARNIGAHATARGNAIREGVLVKRRGGGYQLASRVRNQFRRGRDNPHTIGSNQMDVATKLPTTIQELDSLRRNKSKRSLVDAVEDIMRKLMANEKFRKYLLSTNNDNAVEGSVIMDDTMMAMMIRDEATNAGASEVAAETLAEVVRAMRRALNRYDELPRKARRANGEAQAQPQA